MSRVLKISPELSLPLDAVTRRMAILAMSGAGKSNVAVVLAEQMFDAGIPWVAIDPKGDWWGVRSSATGRGPGLPIPIFGGLHGDIPLEPMAGKLIGELIVDQRLTCVLDVSEFEERQGMWAFLTDLGTTLLKRNRQALHLFLEEADEYLPQKTSDKGHLPRCLGVWQRVVKRGRFRGIGTTQITQRNASLNKDTLYMAEALIAMRVTGKGDRDAIKGWVEYHNAAAEIVTSLPTLGDGDGWVSSPAWLRKTEQVHFNRRRTFDSGATPVHLQGSAPPATLADVDLDQLRTRMTATIEKAKAEDPGELRKRIRELERELKAKPAPAAAPKAEVKVQRIEVPVLKDGQLDRFERATQVLVGATSEMNRAVGHVGELARGILTALQQVRNGHHPAAPRVPARGYTPEPTRQALPVPPKGGTGESRPSRDAGTWGGNKKAGDYRMLVALAQYPEGLHASRLALLSRVSVNGGSFDTYISRLRKPGWIEGDRDRLRITQAGMDAVGEFTPLPTGDELIRYWHHQLGGGAQRMFDILVEAYPERLTDRELGERAAVSVDGGSFDTYISKLRTLDLIDGKRSELGATPRLFE